MAERMQQIELRMPTRGGRRKGAGRKRRRLRPTVAHARRPHFVAGHPAQVTLRMCEGVPSLREPDAWAVIVRVLRAMRMHAGFRIVHFSVMTNHIHAIVEGDARECFEAGMRALSTRLALRLNRLFGRRGRLIEHRYHARALSTPRAVRSSLQYVLCNLRKHGAQHGQRFEPGWIDRRSSAPVFDGWDGCEVRHGGGDYGVSPARTWLLREGWRRWGLLAVDTVPGQPVFDSAIVASRRVTGGAWGTLLSSAGEEQGKRRGRAGDRARDRRGRGDLARGEADGAAQGEHTRRERSVRSSRCCAPREHA